MPGQRGEADPFPRIRRFEDMPLNYQALGRACAELDLEEEFFWLVDSGFDFGRVYPTILRHIHDKLDHEKLEETQEWLRLKHGIDLDGNQDMEYWFGDA
ncbi:TPA: hypothetical protein DCF80_04325 [Candidatus Saccharibacteria bacterium]|nr:hypothetical protein [Candidatus Saccharibacteria bacterium]HRK41278.1 hypothetical protein [Candidatus Saccharibacteria bacterium]